MVCFQGCGILLQGQIGPLCVWWVGRYLDISSFIVKWRERFLNIIQNSHPTFITDNFLGILLTALDFSKMTFKIN